MKNNYSNIFTFSKKTLKKAIDYLNKANVVGLPTETVYGLGGNAYSEKSINKIYRLKDIPKAGMLTSLPEEETPTTTYTSQKVMKTGHSKSVKGDQSKLV